MPDLDQNLSLWQWGEEANYGLTWIYAYEEDPCCGEPIPDWLLNLCIAARNTYGCNWVLLDPAADVITDLPTY